MNNNLINSNKINSNNNLNNIHNNTLNNNDHNNINNLDNNNNIINNNNNNNNESHNILSHKIGSSSNDLQELRIQKDFYQLENEYKQKEKEYHSLEGDLFDLNVTIESLQLQLNEKEEIKSAQLKIIEKYKQKINLLKYNQNNLANKMKEINSFDKNNNQNLISHFGEYRSDLNQFNSKECITYNNKLNIMGVSEYYKKRVKIMDKNGSIIRSFPVEYPRGIVIISSLNLIAISSFGKHVIEIYDLSPLLPTINNNININNNDEDEDYIKNNSFTNILLFNNLNNNNTIENNINNEPLPLHYTIGKGRGGREDHFHFNGLQGLAFSQGKSILAIADSNNQRIEIFKLTREGYEHHSFISTSPFNLNEISISPAGDIIIFSTYSYDKINFKIFKEEEGGREGWKDDGEILIPSSLDPPLNNPRGIAVHSSLNYFVICDEDNHRILFFNILTRDLICSFQPVQTLPLPPFTSPYFFNLGE